MMSVTIRSIDCFAATARADAASGALSAAASAVQIDGVDPVYMMTLADVESSLLPGA